MKNQQKIILYLFLVAVFLGVVTSLYFRKNSYSKDLVRLEILAPSEARAGEEVNYIVKYKNNGSSRLEDVNLIFEYPKHSIPVGFDSRRINKEIKDIYPGEEDSIEFKARLFGRKGDGIESKVLLTYRPKEIKAFYESESSSITRISEAPLSLNFDLPSKMVPGKKIDIVLNYYSDLEWALSGLGIKLKYPSGFVSSGKEEWEIPVLNKAEGGRIETEGRVDGEPGDRISIGAELGVWIDDQFIVIQEEDDLVKLIEPEIVINQRVNDFSPSAGEQLHYQVFFRNVGDSSFKDLTLVSKLSGPFESLEASRGEIGGDSIVWDSRHSSRLTELRPGQEGMVEFRVNPKENLGRNPVLENKISIMDMEESFETKLSSKLSLDQNVYYEDDVFGNTGPIPPEVGERTTYTVSWVAKSENNDLENTKVKAVLPEGVTLTGEIMPEKRKDNFTFDSKSREIVWSPGTLPANESKGLSFQIELEPESSQSQFLLVENATLVGDDVWTDEGVQHSADAVNNNGE